MNTTSHDIKTAVQVIKSAILQSQARAAQAITHEQLALYYGIGRYVSQNSRNGFWGTGAIKAISEQLTYELPGLKGFSETMIKRMRTFYEEWHDLEVKSVIGMTEKRAKAKANKAFVEFVIQGYNNPMGVATYKATVDQLKALLPPEEELKKLLPDDDRL